MAAYEHWHGWKDIEVAVVILFSAEVPAGSSRGIRLNSRLTLMDTDSHHILSREILRPKFCSARQTEYVACRLTQ